MADLKFRYATMGSGKSTEIIQIFKNYKVQDIDGVVLIPEIDTTSNGKIKSRLGIEILAITVSPKDNIFEIVKEKMKKDDKIKFVIVDESNFLTKEQVDQLGDVVDELNINVLAYGITTDFKGNLFEGSKRLFEIADDKEEIGVRTICWCGKKAICHARIKNGVFEESGDTVEIDKKELEKKIQDVDLKYVSLCRKHYKEKKFRK